MKTTKLQELQNDVETNVQQLLDMNKTLMEIRLTLHGEMTDEQKKKLTSLLSTTKSRIIDAVMIMEL